jgi:multidrug efflux system membrane fusion protein
MDERSGWPNTETADGVMLRERTAPFPKDRAKHPDIKARPGSRLRPLVWLGLVALLAFGIYRFAATVYAPKEPGPNEQATPQPVGVATIGTGDVKVIVNAIGTVTPIATVTVKTQVNGLLMEVGFEEGQTVKKGDFLAQIDPRPFEVAQAQWEGQLAHDQGLLDQARMDLNRYQMLTKQDSIARQQAEDQVYVVKQYEGSVRTDQAQIAAQKLNLIYARIVSPVDGRIGLRLVDPGNYVQTTDPGIAVVAQMHPISVIFVVPEDDLPDIMTAIRAGKEPEVTAYDRANVTPLSVGKVVALDSQIDQTTGTVKLRANFDNLDDKLFPNQFVNARLLLKTLGGAVRVPSRAVQHGAPGTYVYVVGADDIAFARKVELGPQDGDMIAVKSGLKPGERVVVDGVDRLRDGAKVTLVSNEGSEASRPESKAEGAGQPGSAAAEPAATAAPAPQKSQDAPGRPGEPRRRPAKQP